MNIYRLTMTKRQGTKMHLTNSETWQTSTKLNHTTIYHITIIAQQVCSPKYDNLKTHFNTNTHPSLALFLLHRLDTFVFGTLTHTTD